MVTNNSSNSNSRADIIKFFIFLPLIIGVLLLTILLFHSSGLITFSSLLSVIIDYGAIITISATLFLVSITAYYAYATKKMADSTQDMATLTKLNIKNTEQNIEHTKKTIDVMNEKKWHQVLTDIQTDYRSAEMILAISGLWDFYNKCKNNHNMRHLKMDFEEYLKREFIKKYNEEKKEIDNKKLDIKNSLNYKRRFLTHFYFHLATLYFHGIIPNNVTNNNMIFDWWLPSDLKMIDKFIIPLQQALNKKLGYSEEDLIVFKKYLSKLKEDCDSYYDKMKIT